MKTPLLICTWRGCQKIMPDEITYLQANQKSTIVHLINELKIDTPYLLQEVIAMCPDYFIYCHRSFAVNLNHVEKVDEVDKKILLSNKQEVPISAKRMKEFTMKWKSYLLKDSSE